MGIFNLFDLFSLGSDKGGFVKLETERKIQADWSKIDQFISSRQPSQLKQGLIMADRSLDAALKDLVDGQSMGERLKNSKNYFDPVTYNKVWEAHRIRNNMVHEPDYDPPYYVVGDAIANLKMGLIRLKVRVY